MPVEPILAALAARAPKLRTGVDIGFSDVAVSARLRERFHALWMTVTDGSPADSEPLAAGTVHCFSADGTLPFDSNQFEAAVLNGAVISQAIVREIHRVLRPAGMLFFTVEETVRHGPDSTLSKIYNAFLKSGYDIVSVSRPPWWRFGRDGKTLTVSARKKNWRETRPLSRVVMSLAAVAVALVSLGAPNGDDDMAALERAAAGGDVQALNVLGNALIAQAVESSSTNVAEKAAALKRGFGCFKQAAAKKDANAYYNLGMCYMQGYGCESDAGRAFQCFRAAAEEGHPEAINNIGGFYRDGIGVPMNAALSVRWFRKSAELGNAYGRLNYALAMQRGEGTKKDEAAAAEMMRAACDQGCAEAMTAYGMCLYAGKGVKKNVDEAFQWFKKGAEGGFPPAMDNLAECYDKGTGTERDLVKSAEWRMRGRAARGEPNARAWVAREDAKRKEAAK